MTKRKYHHLLTREDDDMWYPQFGDFDKECVRQEVEDTYSRDYKHRDIKVVTLVGGRRALDEYLADLNAEVLQFNPKARERFYARMGGEA